MYSYSTGTVHMREWLKMTEVQCRFGPTCIGNRYFSFLPGDKTGDWITAG